MSDIAERLRFDAARCELHFSKGVAGNIEEAAAEIKRLRAALEFYRNPAAWKKLHDPDDDVRIPDFYRETSFGDTAEVALGHQQSTAGSEK